MVSRHKEIKEVIMEETRDIKIVKHTLILLLAVLAFAVVCMFPAVSAANPTEVIMNGQVAQTFSITVEPSTVSFPMVVGQNEIQSTWVNSTGNSPFKVYVKDTGLIAGYGNAGFKYLDKTGTPQGYMTQPLYAKLGAHAYVPISKSDQDIYTGVAGTFSGQISYKQEVLVSDKATTGSEGGYYWTILTFGGEAI
jgi:hypothetical protein